MDRLDFGLSCSWLYSDVIDLLNHMLSLLDMLWFVILILELDSQKYGTVKF